MGLFKSLNLLLRFLLEIAMLVGFAYWGFTVSGSAAVGVLLGLGAPVVAALMWWLFMAPRAPYRLEGAPFAVAELAFFGLAVAAVYAAGLHSAAIIFLVVYAVNRALMLALRQ
ncbi:YrdB family protein [Salinispira pacifica]